MILKLIVKNIRAHKKAVFLILFVHMLFAAVFSFKYYPWNIYMMYGYLAISFASSFWSFTEKKQNTELLTCNLPVTRSGVVVARYLTSLLIVVVGLILWYLNAFVADLFYTKAVTEFQQITYFKVMFMALFFFSVQQSIFLPSVFSFRVIGMVMTFVAALFVAILTIPLIFYPYKRSYIPYFRTEDSALMIILTLIMTILPVLSAMSSLLIYNKRDIS